jgi:hypothetical protein
MFLLSFKVREAGGNALSVQLRYANNSQYKNDTMIRKEVFCSGAVIEELKRIIVDAEIFEEDDSKWPEPDRTGRQELEVIMGDQHISFATTKLGSMLQVLSRANSPFSSSFIERLVYQSIKPCLWRQHLKFPMFCPLAFCPP